jgi:two-component system OmpR family response regulator
MNSFSHRRILVIEDDVETAGQIADSLTTQGYEVDLATAGVDGLERGWRTITR